MEAEIGCLLQPARKSKNLSSHRKTEDRSLFKLRGLWPFVTVSPRKQIHGGMSDSSSEIFK
jgi:hypothetical protein